MRFKARVIIGMINLQAKSEFYVKVYSGTSGTGRA